jgi:hypothetical protein
VDNTPFLPVDNHPPPFSHSASQDTFLHVRDWLEEARKYAPPGFGTLLIGNKCDRTDRCVCAVVGLHFISGQSG